MPARVIRVATIRRPRWPSRVLRWGLSVAFLLAAVLWILSYFVSVTYSCSTSNVVPATSKGQSITMTVFRYSGFKSGELTIWFPSWHPSNLPPPKSWDFSGFVLSFPRPASIWPTYLGSYASAASIGAFVIPLWFPSALLGILAALLWRAETRRRHFAQAKCRKGVRERFGPALSGTLSAILFLAALVLFPVVYDQINRSAGGFIDDLGQEIMRTHETLWLSVFMFIWFSLAFAAAIPAFRIARWKTCYIPEGLCLNCGYNLTGNTSGICPECGTAILDHMTPTPSA